MNAPVLERDRLSALTTLSEVVRHHRALRPTSMATLFEDRGATWLELDEASDRVAQSLVKNNIGVGDRVAYLGRNTDRFFEIFLGCAKAGAVLAPVNWRLAEPEILFILADTGAKVLFVTSEHEAFAGGACGGVPTLQLRIGVDRADDGIVLGYSSWTQTATTSHLALPRTDAATVVLQLYSSGTTGRPKGVELTQDNILSGARHVLSGLVGDWSTADRTLLALPLFHAGGLLCASYALLVGAANVVLRNADVVSIVEAVRRHRVTKAGFVPTLMQMIVDSPDFDRDAFASIDRVIYGGAPIAPETLQRIMKGFDAGFIQLFGSSETFTVGTLLGPEDHASGSQARLESCGRPLSGVEIRIIDAEGAELPVGAIGEILLKSPTVMKGYWGMPRETAEVLREGWYHTGDLGCLDADGYLSIRDRVRDMIISGGENIYPLEIENALATHPQIVESAVIGVPHSLWGEAVVAVVVRKSGVAVTEDELVTHLKGRIASYKCPRAVAFVDSLPRNASGKVLKRMLRETFAEVL